MPSYRGSIQVENEPPDMKIPATILPHKGIDSVKTLSDAVVRLNMGEFDGEFHYAAVVYISNLKRFILLYRHAGQPWSVDNFKILKKNKEESLDMVDMNKDLQELINECQGIHPITSVSIRRKSRKTVRRQTRNRSQTRSRKS
jgi:hypothetical protein